MSSRELGPTKIDHSKIFETAQNIVQTICAKNGCVFAGINGCSVSTPGQVMTWSTSECGGCNRAAVWESQETNQIHLGSMTDDRFNPNGRIVYKNAQEQLLQSALM